MENAPAVPTVVILESEGMSFPISRFDNSDFLLSQATTISKTELFQSKDFFVARIYGKLSILKLRRLMMGGG